tara:strand:+ start:99 stop:401 length:303 start_codon:yes stop_codon:yes gene_type:complete
VLSILGFQLPAALILVLIKSEFTSGALMLVMLIFVTAVKRNEKDKWQTEAEENSEDVLHDGIFFYYFGVDALLTNVAVDVLTFSGISKFFEIFAVHDGVM